jgi:DNA-binding CsgD family transcriptional regulator
MALVELNSREIASLEILLTSSKDTRQLKRAQAILWLYEGDSVEDVAQRLRVSRQTVYNWVARFLARTDVSIDLRVADALRSGRPRTALEIIDSLIDAAFRSRSASVRLSLNCLDGPAIAAIPRQISSH